MNFEYSPYSGTYHVFRNTAFLQVSTTSLTVGIGPSTIFVAGNKNALYFDANSYFTGVTDVAHSNNDGFMHFAPSSLAFSSTGTSNIYAGLSVPSAA
jgi:hypothetical protein